MSQGNELKFQRGAAANTEFEDRNKGPKNRHHRDGMAGLRKSPALPQPCGILSKDTGVWFRRGRLCMVSPDSQATACLPSGRNSTYRPVQISGTGSPAHP